MHCVSLVRLASAHGAERPVDRSSSSLIAIGRKWERRPERAAAWHRRRKPSRRLSEVHVRQCSAEERAKVSGAFHHVNHIRFTVWRFEYFERLLEVVVAHVVPVVSLAIAQKAVAGFVDAYAYVDDAHVSAGGARDLSNGIALATTEVAMIEDHGLAICEVICEASVSFGVGALPVLRCNRRSIQTNSALGVDGIQLHDGPAGAYRQCPCRGGLAGEWEAAECVESRQGAVAGFRAIAIR